MYKKCNLCWKVTIAWSNKRVQVGYTGNLWNITSRAAMCRKDCFRNLDLSSWSFRNKKRNFYKMTLAYELWVILLFNKGINLPRDLLQGSECLKKTHIFKGFLLLRKEVRKEMKTEKWKLDLADWKTVSPREMWSKLYSTTWLIWNWIFC